MPTAPFSFGCVAGFRRSAEPYREAPWAARRQWMMIDTVEYAGTVIVSLYVPAFVPRATGNWPKPCSVAGTDVGMVRWLL